MVLILCSVATCCIDPLREGTGWTPRYVRPRFGRVGEILAIIGEVTILQRSFEHAQFKFDFVGGLVRAHLEMLSSMLAHSLKRLSLVIWDCK